MKFDLLVLLDLLLFFQNNQFVKIGNSFFVKKCGKQVIKVYNNFRLKNGA